MKHHFTPSKIYSHLPLIILVGLFMITRLWRLDTIPSGLHIDEAAMAYSSWSLAHYGVDRYLDSWPVYLLNFNGGQSAFYPYLCALLFKLFDFSVLLLRIPAVLFSFFTFLFGMNICKEIYPNRKYLPLFCGFLIVVCPYFIMAGRFGLDCNLMLGMSTIFLYCFIIALKKDTMSAYFFAGLAGGLVLYTYALSYLILPLFLITSFVYLQITRHFQFIKWVIMGIPMGLLAFPLLLEQYVNAFDRPEIELGLFTITKMRDYRAGEINPITWENFTNAVKNIFIGDVYLFNSVPEFMTL